MATERRLPNIFYNWTTALGALISVVAFSLIILLLLMDYYLQETTIYLGILTFCVLPVFLALGLILIAVGALRERRLHAKGESSSFPTQISIDLENSRHRNVIMIWTVGTAIFLLGTTVGTYKAYQETESVEFCGQLCHSVMSPEYTAYQVSPHARVECVDCHIGPGAEWFVQAKLSGLRQVFRTINDSFDRPIKTPIHNLRPARDTCEQCHWPDKFFGARKDLNAHFLSDEENTAYPISMLINIGGENPNNGRAEGIHWHTSMKVDYIARDFDRSDIAWVRVTRENGETVEYHHTEDPLEAGAIAEHKIRTMDCIDCHNRPSHNYRSPNRMVNGAMSVGEIDRSLPYIKREAVLALEAGYETSEDAMTGIHGHIWGFYTDEYEDLANERKVSVEATIATVQRIYSQNFFPEMKVDWKAYPDHIGHSEYLGCFRCHGAELESSDGGAITKDCNACHTILAQGDETGDIMSLLGVQFVHPVDIDGEELEVNCTECHEGGGEMY
jgi:nitrate/TMAO reductase-like tetraheme cytochrome c subunit